MKGPNIQYIQQTVYDKIQAVYNMVLSDGFGSTLKEIRYTGEEFVTSLN